MTVRGEQGAPAESLGAQAESLGAQAGVLKAVSESLISLNGNSTETQEKTCVHSHTVPEVERHAAEETQLATENRTEAGVYLKMHTVAFTTGAGS